MADVTYLCLHDHDDDPRGPEQTLNLDSNPYWSHHDFDFYASDPEFPSSDHSLRVHIASHDDDGHFAEQFESSICIRGEDDLSDHGSILSNDLLDRENQVNFIMDLFQQRVEQSQVMDHTDLVSEALNDSTFGVIEGHSDVGIDGLGLDLGFGLGFGFERVSLHDDTRRFMVGSHGSAGDCDDEDDFFIGRRFSGSASGERSSTASDMQPFEDLVRPMGFELDSDDEENDVLGVCVHSEDDYNVHEDNEDLDLASIPLCWDALHLEDTRDNIEDFEWEEVDGRVDEREVFSTLTAEDDRSISVLVSPETGLEEEISDGRVGGMGNLEWEVLLNTNDLDTNPDLSHDGEPFFGEHDDYMYTAEYEMMFGQFGENENPLIGRPPASLSVVQNLPSVILTKEDVENNNALCAVCKDDFRVGEQVKQLPCLHRYHGDCIIPWLGIRNTCPVCRYDCPTDDADYERRRTQRSGQRI